jgi:serine/threonine protein kinase
LVENLVNTTLNGQYSIEKFLGRGGMSEVYLAWDQQRSVFIALKILRQDLAEDLVFLRHFQQEADMLAKLQHPNIVRFYGIEKDDRHVFILMDYIEGTTLQRALKNQEGKPFNQIYINKVMGSICSALHYAHQLKLVHCDIKPANIMINNHGGVLLTDFGIARMTGIETKSKAGFGTPAYMAPELVKGGEPTPQSDIYSLGIVLYEMVTGGKRPFSGSNTKSTGTLSERVRWEQVHLSPPSPKTYYPTISTKMESVVMNCLAKNPKERFKTSLDLLNSLELSVYQDEKEIVGNNQKKTLIEIENTTISDSIQKTRKPTPKRILLGGGLLVVLVSVLLFALFQNAQRNNLSTINASPMLPVVNENITSTANAIQGNPTEPASPAITDQIQNNVTKMEVQSSFINPGRTEINPIDNAVTVYVPEGEFLMGSDDMDAAADQKPAHEVYLDAFWLYQTEVTNQEYRMCIEAGSCSGSLDRFIEDTYPAVFINWDQAKNYCEWAGGRLPTEAEWEKAARGTDMRKYPWGDQSPNCDLANFQGCLSAASEVGRYTAGASPFGALDLAGNVWEWVSDWVDENYYSKSPMRNPPGPNDGTFKIVRGGSWTFEDEGLVTSSRYWIYPDLSSSDIGFRCVIEPSQ